MSPESEPYESAGPAQPSSINTTEGFLLGWTEQDRGLQAEILMDFRKNIKFFLSRIPWENKEMVKGHRQLKNNSAFVFLIK